MGKHRSNHEELARRAAAELKETEDLLAGFDRPGRTPRPPPTTRDFVDYHLDRQRSSGGPRPISAERAARDLPTSIVARRTPASVRKWIPYAVFLAVMPVVGVIIAMNLGKTRPSTGNDPPLPGVATLASGASISIPTSGPERDIPPPPPPTSLEPPTEAAAANEPAPRPKPARMAPAAGSPNATGTSSAPTKASESAPPPLPTVRDMDMIRNL